MYKDKLHPHLTSYINLLQTHKVYNGNQMLILLAPHIVEAIECKYTTREELSNDLGISLSRFTNLLPVLTELPIITSKLPEPIDGYCELIVMTNNGVIDLCSLVTTQDIDAAWQLLTSEMAGGLHQYDDWVEVPEYVQKMYIGKVKELSNDK